MSNNPQLTWNEFKNSLGEYYGLFSNPNARLVELVNIKQGRTEGTQDYTQRVVRLAESAYVGVDGRNEVVAKQVLGFFIERLKGRDIKMAVMREEPQTLDAAYQKSELKGKTRLDASSGYEDEPMVICHSRRRVPIEAMIPGISNNNRNNSTRMNKNNKKGSNNGENTKLASCWNCGEEGHIVRFCERAPGNSRGPFVRHPPNGKKMYRRT